MDFRWPGGRGNAGVAFHKSSFGRKGPYLRRGGVKSRLGEEWGFLGRGKNKWLTDSPTEEKGGFFFQGGSAIATRGGNSRLKARKKVADLREKGAQSRP